MRNMANSLATVQAISRFRRRRTSSISSGQSAQDGGAATSAAGDATPAASATSQAAAREEDGREGDGQQEAEAQEDADADANEDDENDQYEVEGGNSNDESDEDEDGAEEEEEEEEEDDDDDDDEDDEKEEVESDEDVTTENAPSPGVVRALIDVIRAVLQSAADRCRGAARHIFQGIDSTRSRAAQALRDADNQLFMRRFMGGILAIFVIGILGMLPRDVDFLGSWSSPLDQNVSGSSATAVDVDGIGAQGELPTSPEIVPALDMSLVTAIVRQEMDATKLELGLDHLEKEVEQLAKWLAQAKTSAEEQRDAMEVAEVQAAVDKAIAHLEPSLASLRAADALRDDHAKELSNLSQEIKKVSDAARDRLQAAEDALEESQREATKARDASTAAKVACEAKESAPNLRAHDAGSHECGGNSCRNLTLLRSIVDERLEVFSADTIGIRDHALESVGSRIVHGKGLTAGEYSPDLRTNFLAWLDWKLSPARPAEAVIDSDTTIGNCWACEPSNCNVTIELHRPLIPTDVSVDHIPEKIALHMSSAPRDFHVWGLRRHPSFAGDEQDQELLGTFRYDIHQGKPVQTFPLHVKKESPLSRLKFQFTSNHGHANYTCVYRVRIHGKEWEDPIRSEIQD
ncbi:SUN domain-containing protein 2 [Hondaea fermentalgiana]|uniref:SUN domain-containing protein 2 n=1 Tax=Hondaea fermentalgiana TaxID=2315210 RepID=A0A2R5G9W2_9STRA|nr:SUN domain-containing protein 2 [Hondaea fermentalgiana]|eukprot:GBG27807.1 SUN domain-containing protein 2 [Hondaea fermentalgiana]